MTPETEAKINEYLADETKLYQDWYLGLSQTEDSQYTQEVGVLPKLSELQKMCENWIKQQTPFIKESLMLRTQEMFGMKKLTPIGV
jgi:hypothetical protein